jgi:hypothetical protein
MGKVDINPKPEHSRYIERCSRLIQELEDRIVLKDWVHLWNDDTEKVYSWSRNTSTGLKSMKAELTINGSIKSLCNVLNDNGKYR